MNMRYCLLFLLFLARVVFACDVKDDTGQIVHLPQAAKRIVSLAPDLTEILFSIGAGNRIVGVMRGSDYPPAATHIPVMASYNNIDAEAILALHPDLIVAWTDVPFLSQLKSLGIPIYYSHQKAITDIPVTMRRLGCLTGNEQQAVNAADIFLKQYQQIKNAYAHKKSVTVFYQVWSKPLMTISKESWINEVISLCGGKNIFSNLHGAAPQVSLESVIVANPMVIIGSDVNSWLQKRPKHSVFSLNTDLVERAGPRILEGTKEVCHKLDEARDAEHQR